MENINKILSEIPESEKTATVVLLVEIIGVLQKEIQELKDEIARLKGNPPKPKLKPSTTSKIDKAVRKKTSRRKKRRAKKTVAVEIHNTVELHPENIPEGSEFLWYRDYTVQDIVIKANNTKYRRGVWKTPSGEIIRGKFPEPIKGHYGEKLKSYILYLYHELHVTQPLIFSHLNEIGVNISEGQINNILIENQDIFHNEKEELLEVGLRISPHIVSDDTGLRHKGKNGYCTHIGNELFAYFKSSDSKSRINFLEIMRGKNTDYCINGYAILYYEEQKLSNHKLMLLKRSKGKKFNTRSEWLTYLKQLGIRDEFHIKKATEGAPIHSFICLFTEWLSLA